MIKIENGNESDSIKKASARLTYKISLKSVVNFIGVKCEIIDELIQIKKLIENENIKTLIDKLNKLKDELKQL